MMSTLLTRRSIEINKCLNYINKNICKYNIYILLFLCLYYNGNVDKNIHPKNEDTAEIIFAG